MLEPFGDLCVSCVKVNIFLENKKIFFKNRGRTLNGVKLFLQILWTEGTKIWYLNDNHFTPVLEASSQEKCWRRGIFRKRQNASIPPSLSHWDPLCTHVNVFSVDVFNVIKEYSGEINIFMSHGGEHREREELRIKVMSVLMEEKYLAFTFSVSNETW